MNVLLKLMCAAGLHSGQWSLPGDRCDSVRVCARCGKTDEVFGHTWSGFVHVDTRRCEQLRRCGRCAMTQSRTQHEWGPWRYSNTEFGTPQIHRCRRCHETEKTAYTLR
jgi:hypothetical protein